MYAMLTEYGALPISVLWQEGGLLLLDAPE